MVEVHEEEEVGEAGVVMDKDRDRHKLRDNILQDRVNQRYASSIMHPPGVQNSHAPSSILHGARWASKPLPINTRVSNSQAINTIRIMVHSNMVDNKRCKIWVDLRVKCPDNRIKDLVGKDNNKR